MYVLDIFSGTGTVSKKAQDLGHTTFTVDIDPIHKPDKVYDMLNGIDTELFLQLDKADFIWLSFPCTTFSMAAGNKHWNADHTPKTQEAQDGYTLLKIAARIADYAEQNGKVFVMENPRARARWFLPEDNRYTVWYCQYGYAYAKPTDIWTNIEGFVPKQCRNNSITCHHVKSPRGSKNSIQGLPLFERYKIPGALITELLILGDNDL